MSSHNRYQTELYLPSPVTPGTLAGAAVATAVTAVLLIALPELSASGYAKGDEYLCGDLGSMGASITAGFGGLFLFLFTVAVAAGTLKRKAVLLVAPAVIGVAWAAYSVPASLLTMRFGICGSDMSVLTPLLVAAAGAGLTYLFGRSAVLTRRG